MPSLRSLLSRTMAGVGLLVGVAGTARAQLIPGLDLSAGEPRVTRRFEASDVLAGWAGFVDVWRMIDMVVVLILAILLGAAIAYHPLVRSKAASIEELEQPKTFIMYSLVAALCGVLVGVAPAMAVVVFGIGGLLRFRTNVGPAKDTGRVILAVVVGLLCGIKLYDAAIFGTAFGWILTYVLETQDIGRMQVKGLEREAMLRAAEAYRKILTQAGCKILGEKKKFTKGTVTFVFNAPRKMDREALEQYFYQAVPEDIRGAVDWDIS